MPRTIQPRSRPVSPGFRQLPGGSDKKSCGSPPRTTPFQYETSVLNREYRKTIDDVQMTWGMRKLPPTAAEYLLGIVMRRYEPASTPILIARYAARFRAYPALWLMGQ